jgi:hypothetical protein
MAHETTIAPKTLWKKILIYWHTKNHSRKIYDIALILAVAIFTNRKIYLEELEEARHLLLEHLRNADDVDNVMEYVEMKLASYVEARDAWHEDQKTVRVLIEKDEELYAYLLSIFEADEMIDAAESLFEESLKKALRRS